MNIKCIKIVFLLILVHLAVISKADFSNDSTSTIIIKIGSIYKLNTNFYSMPVILNYNDSIKDKIIDFQIDVQDKYFDEYKYLYSVDPKYFVTKNSTKKETILFNIETRDTNSKNYYKIKVRSRGRLDSNVAEYKTKGYLQQKNIIKKSSANFTSNVNLDFTDIYDATDKKIRIEKVEKEKSALTAELQNTLKSLSNTKSEKIHFTWSLTKSIQTKLTTIDSASLADTLQKYLNNYAKLIFVKEIELNTKKENIEKEIWSLENELEDTKTLLNKTTSKSPNIAIPDNITEASEIVFKSSTYKEVKCKVFIYDPRVHTLDINYNSSFSKTINYNYAEGKNTLFMTNGGMFHSDFSPVGLLIINGKPKSKLNTQNPNNKENFYLLPNGLFYITPSGEGKVMETHTFKNQDPSIPIKFASQSGPMLLVNDKPNPNFVFKSDNDKIRSGVGEMKDGKLVFIVSEEPVNFYDFTLLFKHRYGCKNALFLDGAISEGYINTGMRTNISNRNFGSVISICRKR